MNRHEEMEYTLEFKDFTDPKEAAYYCVMGDDGYRYNEAAVDADIDLADPSVGCGAQCYLQTVSVKAWDRDWDVLPQLTDKCRKRIEKAYMQWAGEREESRRESAEDSYVDAKIEEWKERRRG